jgi:hypothetical protein
MLPQRGRAGLRGQRTDHDEAGAARVAGPAARVARINAPPRRAQFDLVGDGAGISLADQAGDEV